MHHKFELSSIFRTLLAFPRVPYYSYKPLGGPSDAIRLLLLQPAPFKTSPIQCKVIETTWGREQSQQKKAKGYSALSYTWGDIAQTSRIEIDGRRFHITKNLEQALRHLRLQRSTVKLWADSLCINQTDIEERNLHVSQMREIYSAAKQTIIFLGEATEGSDALFHAMQSASPLFSQSRTRNAIVKALKQASGIRKSELQSEALKILCRAYWTRIWIFQEIVVSNNPWVQCGDIAVPWDIFCQSLIALLEFDANTKYWGSGYSNAPRQRLEDMYWERRAYRLAKGHTESMPTWDMGNGHVSEGRMKLLDLLVTKRGSQATDARDMVFAVSGIASKPSFGGHLRISYEKSPALVYMDTVEYLLKHDGSGYEVLSHAGLSTKNNSTNISTEPSSTSNNNSTLISLPSWAPDWRLSSPYKTRISDWLNTSSTRREAAHIQISRQSILAIPGRIHATLISLSPPTSDHKPSGDSIGRVIWSSPTIEKAHRRTLLSHGILTRLGTVREMFARSHPLTYRRKFAELGGRGGTLCLVPQEAEAGDVVALFEAGEVPFVLRRISATVADHAGAETSLSLWMKVRRWFYGQKRWAAEREEERRLLDEEILSKQKEQNSGSKAKEVGHFLLVGECYIDGFMDAGKQDGGETKWSNIIFALH